MKYNILLDIKREIILYEGPNKPSNTHLCVCVPSRVPVKPKRYLALSSFDIIDIKDFDLN